MPYPTSSAATTITAYLAVERPCVPTPPTRRSSTRRGPATDRVRDGPSPDGALCAPPGDQPRCPRRSRRRHHPGVGGRERGQQPVRETQDPLPNRHVRNDGVHEVDRTFRHPLAATTGADRPPLARERHEPVEAAVAAADPREATRQDPALEEVPKRPLHKRRHTLAGGATRPPRPRTSRGDPPRSGAARCRRGVVVDFSPPKELFQV
jgi:hypothetical protein